MIMMKLNQMNLIMIFFTVDGGDSMENFEFQTTCHKVEIQETTTYEFDNGFYLDIVRSNDGDSYETYLYHDDYGVKWMLWGAASDDSDDDIMEMFSYEALDDFDKYMILYGDLAGDNHFYYDGRKKAVDSIDDAHKIIQEYSIDDAYRILDLFNTFGEHDSKHDKFIASCILNTIEEMNIKDAYNDMIKSMEDNKK